MFLVEFTHDSRFLGYNRKGILLIKNVMSFEEAVRKVKDFSVPMRNEVNGFEWEESFTNARDFINLTV